MIPIAVLQAGASLRSVRIGYHQHRRDPSLGHGMCRARTTAEARQVGISFFGRSDGLSRRHYSHCGARRGLGALLAEGSESAPPKKLGQGSAHWAMHVKGLELPGYEPRSLKTTALLGLAVSPRGACHNRSGAYETDFSGAVDRFHAPTPQQRRLWSQREEDFAAVLDSLIICKFLRKCFDDFYAEAADLLCQCDGMGLLGNRSCEDASASGSVTLQKDYSTNAKASGPRMIGCRHGC